MDTPRARPGLPEPDELERLPPDGGPDWNRLVFEGSPYLLQHAANPVDWWPWSDEAFAEAEKRDVPVFLSIGYSTCHWCHVMEHESFEDDEVASLLNAHFVPVKVDREERPDVDQLYMTVTQAMTGQGGWPMSVVLAPDRKPFFAGTYFPKHGRFNRPGMMELLPALSRSWREERSRVHDTQARILAALQQWSEAEPGEALGEAALDAAQAQLASRFDSVHGGFGRAPKFPTPHVLTFLLRQARRTGRAEPLAMVETSLDAMRRGGLFDHVGRGFSRYSTDERWLLPHFEKMLYDQAQLVLAYTEAHQATGREHHATVVREVMDYVLRDLTGPEGGFLSAEDADSEGVEGKFYLWTRPQLVEVLGDELGELAARAWGVQDGGNFRDQATGERTGESILHLPRPLEDLAKELGLSHSQLAEHLETARRKLFVHREARIHPLKDDKVLTDWNGLMIAAAARAGAALDQPAWIEAAGHAADFVLRELRTEEGRLLKRWRAGRAAFDGLLDDHAFLIWGLIELHQASQDPRRLSQAEELTRLTLKHFHDADSGGFFLSADDGEALLLRNKEIHDGALPSGNSVMAWNLLRLSSLLGRPEWAEEADRTLRAFAGSIARAPSAHAQALHAVGFTLGAREVVIAGETEAPTTKAMLAGLRRGYHPEVVVLLRTPENAAALGELAPFTKSQVPIDGRTAAYVCRAQSCAAPVEDVDAMLALLEDGRGG